MTKIAAIAMMMGCAAAVSYSLPSAAEDKLCDGAPNATAMGWRLGCQAYSFNKFTFFEAVDKNEAVGLKVIEMYPGQPLSKEKPEITTDHNMTPETMAEIKAKLDKAGIKLVNYGVVGLPADEAECRKVFEWGKAMGLETIVSEPPEDAFDILDKLCEEYQINVAIHNHPKPSKYWNPERVVKVCEGHSKRIGACCDTGHWMRSGVDPLAALKMLEGRIISFHIKNLNEATAKGHDMPWGEGAGDMKAWLTEVKRQGVQCTFSIEYEYNWENSLPEIAKCVQYFDQTAVELSK